MFQEEAFPQGTEFPLAKDNSQGELSCEAQAGSVPVSWGEYLGLDQG